MYIEMTGKVPEHNVPLHPWVDDVEIYLVAESVSFYIDSLRSPQPALSE